MLRQILKPVFKNALRANAEVPAIISQARFASNQPIRSASMDDLPIPQGDWETQYKANQARYNTHLALGALFLIASIATAKASGLVYFNHAPPELTKD